VSQPTALPTPNLRFYCSPHVDLGPPHELGNGRSGRRRIIPIIGGRVEGPGISGRILSVGADWQTIFADGMAQPDTRYVFQTDDGALDARPDRARSTAVRVKVFQIRSNRWLIPDRTSFPGKFPIYRSKSVPATVTSVELVEFP